MFSICGRSAVAVLRTAGDVLPRRIKPSARAREQALLFLLLQITINLLLIQFRCPEQRCYEDNDVYAQERELCPEQNHAKEGEVDGDAVDESADDTRRANLFGDGVLGKLGTALDFTEVLCAIRVLSGVTGCEVAESLRTKGGILWRHNHGDGVVEGQHNECEQNCRHEERLWRCVVLADLEKSDPKEANTNGSDANDRCGEEEQYQQEEEHIVYWEHFGRLDQDPIDRLEDVDASEDVSAVRLAHGILRLVDASDKHAREDEKGENHEDESTNELQRSEYSFSLDPGLDKPMAVFAACLGSQTLSSDQSPLFADESFQFAPISGVQTTFTALVAAFQLPLTLAVLFEL